MDSNVVLYQSQIWLEPFPKANKSLLCNCIFYEKSNKYCNSEMKKYTYLVKMQVHENTNLSERISTNSSNIFNSTRHSSRLCKW